MEQINSKDFNDKGYVILKNLISHETIDNIIQEIYINNPDNIIPGRLTDAWKNFDSIGKLAFDNKILNILENLYNKKPVPFQTLNFYRGTEQKLHSDQIHFCSEPENFMCGLWIAFEDITMEKGPLIYYPGSQKFEFYDMQKLNLKVGDYPSYENKIDDIIKKSKLAPEYGLIKKGDAIIWHANLIHGGYKRIGDLTRMSMVIHYFFENTKYWTPLFSTPEKKIYRNSQDFINPRFKNMQNDLDFKKDLKNIQNKNLWVKYYKKKYSDLNEFSDSDAIKHYYEYGINENREFIKNNFNWESYKFNNPDVLVNNEIDAITHYINFGMFENRKL